MFEYDSKLQMFIEDLKYKFCNLINGGNKKVFIFMVFVDIVNYFYEQLFMKIKEICGFDMVFIIGFIDGRCILLKFFMLFNNVLIYFLFLLKDCLVFFFNVMGEIDVFIVIDCISEG